MRAATLFASFRYAFEGIVYLFRTQRNAQIHAAVSFSIVLLGAAFQISQSEWLAIVLAIMIVIGAEGANTAIEAVVDLVSPSYHPLAKIAKDVAAGTVLLAALGAVVIGMIIFLPRLWALIFLFI
ncbi:MAG TPA: diacylglycerol kinase family protein [Roseiflexaceae bacterium]|jgi:diacylglycerol kinase (ATP)|nr:diacylglycerol kinase family protein [Roseiflexaceae bacterium]